MGKRSLRQKEIVVVERDRGGVSQLVRGDAGAAAER
jgi:hypothetical protein